MCGFVFMAELRSINMTYRLYSGPPGAQDVAPLDAERRLFKEFGNLDAALDFAYYLQRRGSIALLIDGDDGTRLDRRDIAAALWHRERRPGSGSTASASGIHT
jgi:hypothetical protein